MSWVKPENFHVTLSFLGEVEDVELLELDPVLRDVACRHGPLRLVACGLGSAPDPRTGAPRVVWCGVKDAEGRDGALASVHQDLKQALAGQRVRAEKRSFEPHITLGRARGPERGDALTERMGPAVRREFGHFSAAHLTLFESVRDRQGIAYEPLQRFTLSGSRH